MRIKCYRTNEYHSYDVYEGVKEIWSQLEPEEMTDKERKALRKGTMQAMCNFEDAGGTWHIVPWQFVISIEDD